ncbi:MAG: PKD domain-containing protein [Chlorobi bacterium]|nr:PKD domain-containing protein [Chlorobiota bacterium]
MKTLKFFIPFMLIFTLHGCIIDSTPDYPEVDACFTVSGSTHYINEPVYFINCSQDAVSYEWNFGDGFSSNQRNPSHTYTQTGTYQVTMTAYGYDTYETFTDAVTVSGSTDLAILVMYAGTEDPVSNCEVQLYSDYTDWENLTNPVSDIITTGTNGSVVFQGLEPVEYYVDAYRGVSDTSYYSNFLQPEEYFRTGILEENKINFFKVYVELLYNTGKRASGRKNAVVKKIELSSKEEYARIIKAFEEKK